VQLEGRATLLVVCGQVWIHGGKNEYETAIITGPKTVEEVKQQAPVLVYPPTYPNAS
jgi:hypothetical protein